MYKRLDYQYQIFWKRTKYCMNISLDLEKINCSFSYGSVEQYLDCSVQ